MYFDNIYFLLNTLYLLLLYTLINSSILIYLNHCNTYKSYQSFYNIIFNSFLFIKFIFEINFFIMFKNDSVTTNLFLI